MRIRRPALLSVLAFPTLVAQAKVILVSGNDSEAIAAAIAQAKPGDTVSLPEGAFAVSQAIRLIIPSQHTSSGVPASMGLP
jgi:polygalacturonase